MQREHLASRLGFILLSAGCAIGVGNVWKFPWMAGQYGGGAFVLVYLLFLLIIGVPVLTMEFAMGRAAQTSPLKMYGALKPGSKWGWHGYVCLIGNVMLMMFYTTVAGWMLEYFVETACGKFTGLDGAAINNAFPEMLSDPGKMIPYMAFIVVSGFAIISLGVQKGLERVTKWMMTALILLMWVLAINSLFLKGGSEGLKFYLVPSLDKMAEAGYFNVIVSAMNQAFFTLSLGIGAMAIFGSYIGKDRRLFGETISVGILDTCVAFVSGLIIFPSAFAFGVNPDSGSNLIFITLPNVFNAMPGGRLWGALFFVFLFFAALSTITAVFENILACWMDKWGVSRGKAVAVNLVLIFLLSLPCLLGNNLWSGIKILGMGIMDFEDFLVSNNLLPIGSVIYLLFCCLSKKIAWGFDGFRAEADQGKGVRFPAKLRMYFTVVVPIIVLIIFIMGYIEKFA